MNSEWFYIRYYDPKPHLRIRLKCKQNGEVLLNNLFKIQSSLIENEMIDDFKINVYYREVERYGYEFIDRFEKLFNIDSNLCMSILKYENLVDEKTLISILIKIHDKIFSSLFNRIDISDVYNTELLKIKSNKKYYYNNIEEIIPLIILDDDLNLYTLSLSNLLKKIIIEMKEKYSKKYILNVINSVIHMHFNRLFCDNIKEREFRTHIYRFLKYRKREINGNNS
ncbi:thiopeptide-type bacteriocin biosynthesis domain-containing protein [Facklamia miroungae]|uniref:Thiopeptide-type bacteriocin biosynthesis domain-containing protein n=1 Tax=Facklamia miroungae TaxID=120956 RepID=A0A1G7VC72_9LACT|nr:thiopeptide-type bacteriocin biosynthesis domain-containing protein [Facklamia miroungae]